MVSLLLLSTLSVLATAYPTLLIPRNVTSLNQAAVAEAQPRDNTATRAFSKAPIKTSDGSCLFVDPLSGDFRENLTPVQVVKCDSTAAGQQWDVITKGVHQNAAGQALIVSSLTNACLNFDPRRAPGNQVLLFSCGGRADGGGQVTNSQQFAFAAGSKGPQSLQPANAPGTCIVPAGKVLDQAKCDNETAQEFTFGA